jgi:hypothetical protein
MDYVTRQFINLTKQLRKELRKALSRLNGALDKQTAAISKSQEARDAKESPTPEVTVLNNLPESIEVHQNTKDARDERNYKRAMFFITSLTLGAIVIYADLVYWQYREMINATKATQDALTETRLNRIQGEKVFDATVAQFRLDERPWVGLATVGANKPRVEMPLQGGNPKAHFFFVNTGKSAAREVKTRIAWKPPEGRFAIPTNCRDARVEFMHAPYIAPQGTFELREPTIDPLFYETFGRNYWARSYQGAHTYYCMFGEIVYSGPDNTPYVTHFCVAGEMGGGDVWLCPYYNDLY